MGTKRFVGRRVLITGGDGFIGSHLTKASLGQGAEVCVVSLSEDPWRIRSEKKNFQYRKASVTSSEDLTRVFREFRPEIVFHLAALIPATKPSSRELREVIVSGTKNVAQAAVVAQISQLITLGTADEYGMAARPSESSRAVARTPYGVAKAMASSYLMQNAKKLPFSTAIIRPSIAYGPSQTFGMFIPNCIRACLEKKEFQLWGQHLRRDFIFIGDLIDALLTVPSRMNRKIDVWNIGSGEALELERVAHNIAKPLEGNVLIKTVNTKRSAAEPRTRSLDIEKARRDLAWRPRRSLQAGLRETIDWYAEHRDLFPLLERK